MRNRRTALTVAVTGIVGGLLIMWGASAFARGEFAGEGPSEGTQVLLGNDLARSLGLTPIVEFPVTACHYFAEARDLVTGDISAYCLDSVVDDDLSFTKMAIMFKGRVPTSVDERIFNLQVQLSELPDDASYDAQRASIAAEITELQAQQG